MEEPGPARPQNCSAVSGKARLLLCSLCTGNVGDHRMHLNHPRPTSSPQSPNYAPGARLRLPLNLGGPRSIRPASSPSLYLLRINLHEIYLLIGSAWPKVLLQVNHDVGRSLNHRAGVSLRISAF